MHLKVIRAFIDGVLRFGIPPRFYIGLVQPVKGQEKHLLANLNEKFDDKTLAGMYAASGKEEAGIGETTEDFFSFVSVPLTSPLCLM
jgi:V-ATPase subunit C